MNQEPVRTVADLESVVRRVRECIPEIELVRDAEMRDKIERIWAVAWQESAWPDLLDAAFAADAPNFRLIDHVRGVVQGCRTLALFASDVQKLVIDDELLLALALLHDVSKLVEIEPDAQCGARQSPFGTLVQHGVYTAHLALSEGLPVELVHLILTHTPYSKLQPAFLEGVLHQHVDMANAEVLLFANRHGNHEPGSQS